MRGSEKRVGSECGESEKPELLAEALGGADADVRAAEVELRGALLFTRDLVHRDLLLRALRHAETPGALGDDVREADGEAEPLRGEASTGDRREIIGTSSGEAAQTPMCHATAAASTSASASAATTASAVVAASAFVCMFVFVVVAAATSTAVAAAASMAAAESAAASAACDCS